jgi:DNA-binding response OmpR family regulator
MSDKTLQGCRILVVEDEYLLADELQGELEDAGAIVIGPVGSLAEATALIHSEPLIHGAILDANLGSELVYPAADLLIERGVPIIFTTGYDPSVIPARFAGIPLCEKPTSIKRVTQAIGRVLHD